MFKKIAIRVLKSAFLVIFGVFVMIGVVQAGTDTYFTATGTASIGATNTELIRTQLDMTDDADSIVLRSGNDVMNCGAGSDTITFAAVDGAGGSTETVQFTSSAMMQYDGPTTTLDIKAPTTRVRYVSGTTEENSLTTDTNGVKIRSKTKDVEIVIGQ